MWIICCFMKAISSSGRSSISAVRTPEENTAGSRETATTSACRVTTHISCCQWTGSAARKEAK
jgi:hypothetical protein